MRTVLWQSLASASLERFVLSPDRKGYHLAGTVVMAGTDGPTEIRYSILTDPRWMTRVVGLHVQSAAGNRRLAVEADGEGNWTVGGDPIPEADGALDVDLSFSPATNTLALNRLSLAEGEAADIVALYLDPFDDGLATRKQTYLRTSATSYTYSSGGLSADLTVDADGLVVDYPGAFVTVARS